MASGLVAVHAARENARVVGENACVCLTNVHVFQANFCVCVADVHVFQANVYVCRTDVCVCLADLCVCLPDAGVCLAGFNGFDPDPDVFAADAAVLVVGADVSLRILNDPLEDFWPSWAA